MPPPSGAVARAYLTPPALVALTIATSLVSLLLFRYFSTTRSPSTRRSSPPPLPRRPSSLRHSYYLIRHGQSEANVAAIISSTPAVASVTHGLTDLGRSQAREAGSALASLIPPHSRLSLYSSPFLRARETADEVRLRLRTRGEVLVVDELRERWFGDWDGGGVEGYARVWERDGEDDGHEERGVESVRAVMQRVAEWVMEREKEEEDKGEGRGGGGGGGERSIVMVSHGDTLQISQCWFEGRSGRQHRQVPHLHNGEVRKMTFNQTAMD